MNEAGSTGEAHLCVTPGPRSEGHQPSSKLNPPLLQRLTHLLSWSAWAWQCFPPQALRSSKGLQQEAVLVQSRDTVGMLKQGHQSHRDLNLSKLALESQRIGATGRDFTLVLTAPPQLCGDIGQGRF